MKPRILHTLAPSKCNELLDDPRSISDSRPFGVSICLAELTVCEIATNAPAQYSARKRYQQGGSQADHRCPGARIVGSLSESDSWPTTAFDTVWGSSNWTKRRKAIHLANVPATLPANNP